MILTRAIVKYQPEVEATFWQGDLGRVGWLRQDALDLSCSLVGRCWTPAKALSGSCRCKVALKSVAYFRRNFKRDLAPIGNPVFLLLAEIKDERNAHQLEHPSQTLPKPAWLCNLASSLSLFMQWQ
ncbi:hypothetical protein [Fervidibacter sacchari]